MTEAATTGLPALFDWRRVLLHVVLTNWIFWRVALWLESRGTWVYCGFECFPRRDLRLLLLVPLVLPVWLFLAFLISRITESGRPAIAWLTDVLCLPILYLVLQLTRDMFG